MQAENLFKFVSVRAAAPMPADDKDPLPGLWTPPTNSFLSAVTTRAAAGTPLPRARREQADEFLDSARYVIRDAAWRPLLAVEHRVARLLAAPGDDDVVPALERLLSEALGERVTLTGLVRQERFTAWHDTLWSSFLSLAVRPGRRPQDLPRLLFWLRAFRLLRRVADGEPARALLPQLDRWRPAVPYALVVEPGRPAADVPPPRPDERRERIVAAERARDEVREAHRRLAGLVRAKGTAAPSSRPGGTVALSADEVDADVRATLDRLGLSLSEQDPFDLLERLEQHLAEAHAHADELRRVERVAAVGTTLVRRRYTLTDADLEGEHR